MWVDMEPVTPPLVEQPTAAPTRKWTAATIAEVVTGVIAVAAAFGLDLGEDVDPMALAGGIAALVSIAGRVAAYFTKNKATT